MEKSLDRLDEVLLEGRNRVRDLRDETIPGHELSQLLLACGEELAHDKSIIFTLAVVAPLGPSIRSCATKPTESGASC